MRIFKYELEVGMNEVYLPEVHKLVSVQIVGNKTCLYALVDDDAPKAEIIIFVALTGEYVQPGLEYISTVVHQAGKYYASDFVVHVFNCGKA